MESKRYLGLDYGQRRVGVALSDPSGMIARPIETLIIRGMNDAVEQIQKLVKKHEVVGIVLGLPLNLSGDPSELSRLVEEFAKLLKEQISIPIHFEDERLSSRQAEQVLHMHGKKIKGNKGKIDRISAAIILQSFLDRMGR